MGDGIVECRFEELIVGLGQLALDLGFNKILSDTGSFAVMSILAIASVDGKEDTSVDKES